MADLSSAARRSRLVQEDAFVVHADLHNHSLLSDGLGDPQQAFAQMRAAGLDVAALTDHASIPHHRVEDLDLSHYPDEDALALARLAPRSFDLSGWTMAGKLADEHDSPGAFTALRGFEWTEPWLGHVNVWFSDSYLPVTTPGQLNGLHEWLGTHEPNALFGYNHPGREPGRLHDFAQPDPYGPLAEQTPSLTARMVSLELFNRTVDFLFAGHRDGLSSPVIACLNAGWRPGFVGSSDEHGRSYGLTGRGRAGLWVSELSRPGVREALLAARSFATRERDLRLDATLDGVRMGQAQPAATATGRRELSVDVGTTDATLASLAVGQPVQLQVLGGDGSGGVAVHGLFEAVVGEVTSVPVQIPADTPWVFLRVADPTRPSETPGPPGHPANARGIAYGSPWWFES